MNINILFENENLLVINKPSGLIVHGDGKNDETSVVDWIVEHYPEINGVGENMYIKDNNGQDLEINRPGIVHRIDRDTSGCLLVAKNQTSFEHLKQQFKNRSVEKKYIALVYGWIKEDYGTIDQPIGRSTKDFRMKQAGAHARGELREAQTTYRIIGRYFDPNQKDKQGQFEKYSLVECQPKTGRTHQIRVHLKWLHHPIVSDPLYAGKRKPALNLKRTALHAQAITFQDVSGESISVSCDLPSDINQAIVNLQNH